MTSVMSAPEPLRIMLGFIVRQCAVALKHQPSAAELVEWANRQWGEHGRYCIFGREISVSEAAVILRNPGRLVTVRPGSRWEMQLPTLAERRA
jgi:hypothetical protein